MDGRYISVVNNLFFAWDGYNTTNTFDGCIITLDAYFYEDLNSVELIVKNSIFNITMVTGFGELWV
jgi:hypothetical protein